MNKELKRLLNAIDEQGFDISKTTTGRFQVSRDGAHVTTIPCRVKDYRGIRNAIRPLRDYGITWPVRRQP